MYTSFCLLSIIIIYFIIKVSITDSINICCKFCLFISCNIFFNKLQKRNNRPIKIIIKNTTVKLFHRIKYESVSSFV